MSLDNGLGKPGGKDDIPPDVPAGTVRAEADTNAAGELVIKFFDKDGKAADYTVPFTDQNYAKYNRQYPREGVGMAPDATEQKEDETDNDRADVNQSQASEHGGFRPVLPGEVLPPGYTTRMNMDTGEQLTNAPPASESEASNEQTGSQQSAAGEEPSAAATQENTQNAPVKKMTIKGKPETTVQPSQDGNGERRRDDDPDEDDTGGRKKSRQQKNRDEDRRDGDREQGDEAREKRDATRRSLIERFGEPQKGGKKDKTGEIWTDGKGNAWRVTNDGEDMIPPGGVRNFGSISNPQWKKWLGDYEGLKKATEDEVSEHLKGKVSGDGPTAPYRESTRSGSDGESPYKEDAALEQPTAKGGRDFYKPWYIKSTNSSERPSVKALALQEITTNPRRQELFGVFAKASRKEELVKRLMATLERGGTDSPEDTAEFVKLSRAFHEREVMTDKITESLKKADMSQILSAPEFAYITTRLSPERAEQVLRIHLDSVMMKLGDEQALTIWRSATANDNVRRSEYYAKLREKIKKQGGDIDSMDPAKYDSAYTFNLLRMGIAGDMGADIGRNNENIRYLLAQTVSQDENLKKAVAQEVLNPKLYVQQAGYRTRDSVSNYDEYSEKRREGLYNMEALEDEIRGRIKEPGFRLVVEELYEKTLGSKKSWREMDPRERERYSYAQLQEEGLMPSRAREGIYGLMLNAAFHAHFPKLQEELLYYFEDDRTDQESERETIISDVLAFQDSGADKPLKKEDLREYRERVPKIKLYADNLLEFKKNGGDIGALAMAARGMVVECKDVLRKVGIEPNHYADSISWAMTGFAKDKYFTPGDATDVKRKEIIDRHIGWQALQSWKNGTRESRDFVNKIEDETKRGTAMNILNKGERVELEYEEYVELGNLLRS